MAYKKIDEVLFPWAKNHNLHIGTKYKESVVRSMDRVNADGKRYQIWVDPPDSSGQISVNVSDYRKKRRKYVSSIKTLGDSLDKAYDTISLWDSS